MAELAIMKQTYSIYTGPHFLCSDCLTIFISEEFLNKHQKKCIHRKLHLMLKMKFQLKRNTSAEDASNRPKNETEDYFCEECFSGFLSFSDFESHIQEGHSEEEILARHLSNRNYGAEIKSAPLIAMIPQSEKAPKVTFHNQYNAAKRSLQCPDDQEQLKSKQTNQSLGTHFNNKHTGQKPFVCDQCGKGFSQKSDLKRHLLIHTGKKPFVCDNCGKCFTQKTSLKTHLIIHSARKPFVCDHCDKGFSQNSKFKRHLLIHTGEKPFVCDQCEKGFSQKVDLKRHLLIHTGEKPFVCDQCKKGFSQKVDLKRHLLIHTGEKPFVCDQCDKCFTHKTSLKTHLLNHTGEKPFVCDQCEKGFSDKSNLKTHLKIHS